MKLESFTNNRRNRLAFSSWINECVLTALLMAMYNRRDRTGLPEPIQASRTGLGELAKRGWLST